MEYASLVSSIAALMGVALVFVKLVYPGRPTKKERAEAEKAEAETSAVWENIASRSAENYAKLVSTVNDMRQRVLELEAKVARMTIDVDEKSQTIQLMREKMTDLGNKVFVLKTEMGKKDLIILHMEEQIATLQNGIKRLISQLVSSGMDPEWKFEPDEESVKEWLK